MTDPPSHRVSLESPLTGVAIPVSTLRSTRSCGIGEFLDLPLLGQWCVKSGLSMIQILPVNDTGTQASPYSAVSAFALHPVYVRLEEVPGADTLFDEIEQFRTEAESEERVDLERILGFKLDILYRTYEASLGDRLDAELDAWIEENDWIRPYAVYKCLKDRYEQKSWVDWPEHDGVTVQGLEELWVELRECVRFNAWVQMHLDRQFRQAVSALHDAGVYLKGDIPILMNTDSADVWAHRHYFDLFFGAGAPPDMFTRTGQTWGFPIYRWHDLEKNDYAWWKSRLQVASKYYDAFRIDHVIGFFRIWSQPAHERTAILGHYEPSESITLDMMKDAGFGEADVDRLIHAWTTRTDAEEALGEDVERVLETYFLDGRSVFKEGRGDGSNATFVLTSAIASERLIDGLVEPRHVKQFLLEVHRDRTFIADGDGSYYPTWYWDESKGLASLGEPQQKAFENLISDYKNRSKPVWMALGRKNLRIVSEATDMLACAEDLGAVPEGLREVLKELGILSLKIERWEIGDDGSYTPTTEFPHLSVSTPSVHDLATLRVWWEENDEHLSYFRTLGLDGDSPTYLTTEVAEAIVRRNLESSSAIVIFQIQDLFSLTYDLRMDPPEAERINVPGTVGSHNWSYRMPLSLEDLIEHDLGKRLQTLIEAYRDRKPKPVKI